MEKEKDMLSKFGQLVRALRLQKSMLLSEMAEKLGVSPSYLSAVDFGRRAVPEDWPERISRILALDEHQGDLLAAAAVASTSRSRGAVTVDLNDLTPMQEEVALQFARVLRQLSVEELTAIQSQLVEEKFGEQKWRNGSR